MLLSFIGVNLDLPMILLMMDASQTNFSGWRGAFDQAKFRFRDFQKEISTRLHSQVYRWKCRQWIRQDPKLRSAFDILGPDIFSHEWHYPNWPFVSPMEDVTAAAYEVQTMQTSPRRASLRRGQEWADIAEETVADREMAITLAAESAKRINSRYPDAKVDWRELVNFELPQGYQMALPLQDKSSNATEKENTNSR
jgi:hypothetical protein